MKDINGGGQISFVARMALQVFPFPNLEARHSLKLSIAIPAMRTKLRAREITVYSKEDSPIPLRFVGQCQHQAVKRRIVYCFGQMMIFLPSPRCFNSPHGAVMLLRSNAAAPMLRSMQRSVLCALLAT